MAVNIYFWCGVLLCLCAIIILTCVVIRVRHIKNSGNEQYNENINTLRNFTLLTGSDTISTLITGILLLSLGTSDEYDDMTRKSVAFKCTMGQLMLRLSTFLIPVLTGLTSIPSWLFHLYKCTNCNIRDNNASVNMTMNNNHNKKTIMIIFLQWFIPILSILSTLLSEPEAIKMNNKIQIPLFNMMEPPLMLMIHVDETSCNDELTVENITKQNETRNRRIQFHRYDFNNLHTKNITSIIVNQIYDIVNRHNENNRTQLHETTNIKQTYYPKPLNNMEQNIYVKFMNDLLNYNNNNNNSTDNMPVLLNDNTIKLINNIADIMSNNNNLNKLIADMKNTTDIKNYNKHDNEDLLTGENSLNDINIIKLMENYTRQNDEDGIINMTYLKQNRNATYNNNITIPNNTCYATCQPSQQFLKNLLFVILFINLFIPLIATAVLRAMTYKNIEMMEIKEQHDITHKQNITKILGRNSVIVAVTLSPTLIETITRTLLSIKIPECVSSALLLIALVGTVVQNITGLYIVSLMQRNAVSIHPTEDQQQPEQTKKNLKQRKIYVQDLERQTTSTSTN